MTGGRSHEAVDAARPASAAEVRRSLDAVGAWVERSDYSAYDPGDGQKSYLAALTFGHRTLERVLTAGVLRVPFNIRPALGIRPHTSTKGMGYMAWGYLRRYATLGDPIYAAQATHCLDWLVGHRAQRQQFCWGNDFTFTTRAGRIPRGAPTIVWSGLIGQAFVDAYLALGDVRHLDVAASICDWIMNLPREPTPTGTCLSYVDFDQVSIHNSNMLGAALLARVGSIIGRHAFVELAGDAMRYSCTRQNDDGAWYYGDAPKYHWIDNFHTGYNLDSLKRYNDSTRESSHAPQLLRGFDYFKSNFFEPDGLPKYMNDRRLPVDIQCAAQAVDTLSTFSCVDPTALALAGQVAHWTISHMQAPSGYFYYRDLGWTKVKTPMFHWGQGTMFKALANLDDKLHQKAVKRSGPTGGVAA